MASIAYNFPAMFQQAQNMRATATQLEHQAQIIADEQKTLSHTWQGNTSTAYQTWQHNWNTAVQDMINAYNNMAKVYENNTQSMLVQENSLTQIW